MHQALKSTALQIINLGHPHKHSRWGHFFNQDIVKKDPNKVCSHHYLPDYLKFAEAVEKQLKQNQCGVIFALLIDSELNLIRTNTPIIKLSDTTFKLVETGYSFAH